jgi:hypothetical protein
MRFSIRDLLWLMAVVALGATVFAERAQMQRQTKKWAAEKLKLQQESAAALAAMTARADGLRNQNALLQHQLVVLLEKERQREAENAGRPKAAATAPRFAQPRLRPAPPPTDGAEIPGTIESTR